MRNNFSETEVSLAFDHLSEQLSTLHLPSPEGDVEAEACHFMLMFEQRQRYHFKHRATRCYVSISMAGNDLKAHGDDYRAGYLAMTEEELNKAMVRPE